MSGTVAAPVRQMVNTGAVVGRYEDAYHVAQRLVVVGKVTKALVSVPVLALVVCAIRLLSDAQSSKAPLIPPSVPRGAVVIGIIVAVILGFLLWILGVVVSASGLGLKATLDCAVNSSPFLSDQQRARVMSLLAFGEVNKDGPQLTKGLICPHCGSASTRLWEDTEEGQRWLCNDCTEFFRRRAPADLERARTA